MKLIKGTSVTHTWLTGYDGELERGVVKETCPDTDIFAVRVKFEGDKRSRWMNREELIVHRKQAGE